MFMLQGKDTNGTRSLFTVKVHILKFYYLIYLLIEKCFIMSCRSCFVPQKLEFNRVLKQLYGKIINIFELIIKTFNELRKSAKYK